MTSRCTPEGNVLGHAWDPIPSTKRPPFGEYIWLRCTRGCGTERHDIVNRFNGELLSRSMHFTGDRPAEKLTMQEKRQLYLKQQKKDRKTHAS